MTRTPWREEQGPPISSDDLLPHIRVHFIADDDYDDWGTIDDLDRLHLDFQAHGVPYRVITSELIQAPHPSTDPAGTDETAWGWIAHCNSSFFR